MWLKFERRPRTHASRLSKLSGQNLYRIRQGTYRIIYEIRDDVLMVHAVKVRHRREVYEGY
ncbi:MAG: type II toxin-antitoxin system RelE/ParE family toxin [Candidatus Hydrogenedentes bacterium]|nr:type II toxin-antitoxin system RelE/ParE family toxin [Candidatus Hydrogenedentota bacterium]